MTDSAIINSWVIINVHGTYGRGIIKSIKEIFMRNPIYSRKINNKKQFWFEDGSEFCLELRKKIDEKNLKVKSIKSFYWSGSNSIYQREKASKALSKMILIQQNLIENANSGILIVSHSHGGNVSLRAIGKIKGDTSKVKLVTLATPFLTVSPPDKAGIKYDRAIMYFSFFGSAGLYILLMNIENVSLASVCFLFILTIIGTSMFIQYRRAITREFKIPKKVRKLCAYTSTSQFRKKAVDLLVIRTVDDEASVFLTLSSFSIFVNNLVNIIGANFYKILILDTIIIIAFAAFDYIMNYTGDIAIKLLQYTFIVTEYSFAMFGSTILIAAFTKVVYGRELCMRFFNVEISNNSVLDCDKEDRIKVITVFRGSAWKTDLRHSIYNEKISTSYIAEWLKDFI